MNPYHRLREGSFRGVRFQVAVSAEDETGRRVAIHRYPQRDDAFPEDLGRKSEPFNVEAIIVGADYLARADELFRACGEAGAGELVHPWLGARRVACLTCSRSFTSREGGMARFRLTFILAGQNRYPASVAGAGAPTAAAAETARAAAIGDFARRFVTTGVGSFALNNALALDAEPAADEVVTWLLRAYAGAGRYAELEHAYRSYLRAAGLDALSDAGQQDAVVRLYQSLGRAAVR